MKIGKLKGVYLINTDKPLDNKGQDDLFSTYKYENTVEVGNGYSVKIYQIRMIKF